LFRGAFGASSLLALQAGNVFSISLHPTSKAAEASQGRPTLPHQRWAESDGVGKHLALRANL
jgi:hypothetical protein